MQVAHEGLSRFLQIGPQARPGETCGLYGFAGFSSPPIRGRSSKNLLSPFRSVEPSEPPNAITPFSASAGKEDRHRGHVYIARLARIHAFHSWARLPGHTSRPCSVYGAGSTGRSTASFRSLRLDRCPPDTVRNSKARQETTGTTAGMPCGVRHPPTMAGHRLRPPPPECQSGFKTTRRTITMIAMMIACGT